MNYKLTETQYVAIAKGMLEYQLEHPPYGGGKNESTRSLIARITKENIPLFEKNRHVIRFLTTYRKADPFKFNEMDFAFINKYLLIVRGGEQVKQTTTPIGSIKKNKSKYLQIAKGLTSEEQDSKPASKRSQVLPEIKGHLLIFCLRITGHYEEPFCRGTDALFESINEIIFENKAIDFSISTSTGPIDIEGFYAYKKLSFNSSFPDNVTSSLLRIRVDHSSYGKKVYKYDSYKMYVQNSTGSTLERKKFSEGSIFDYQGNLLFFGKVFYSDMDSTEAILSHKYPEIIYAHRHGGDIQNIRGINLGHYPFLKLPVATSVCLTKIENISKYLDVKKFKKILKNASDDINKDEIKKSEYLDINRFKEIFENVSEDINKYEMTESEYLDVNKFKEIFENVYDDINKYEMTESEYLVELNKKLIQSEFDYVVAFIDVEKMQSEGFIGNQHISRLSEADQKMITNRIERSYSNMLTP